VIGTVRLFNEATDTREQFVEIWNEYYGTTLFTVNHFARFNPGNVIIIDDDAGGFAGFAILLDGGLPYAVLDQLYIRPRHRRFATLRRVFQFVEHLCQTRGIGWFYGLLDQAGHESERFVDQLHRRAAWKAQYMGEKPMFVKHVPPRPPTIPA